MVQQDLLLALQILLDHDDLTEEAHTDALWTIAQLLGGFENLGVCAHALLCPFSRTPAILRPFITEVPLVVPSQARRFGCFCACCACTS